MNTKYCDDWYGMAITEPAARKIDTANAADEWNKKLLDNEARPGMLLMFKEKISDIQYRQLKKDIRENKEGAANAGKSLILEGATDAKPYGFSPSEMDWIKSNTELSRSICIAWGVPPQLIGLPDSQTYANYQEARLAFWEDTMFFYLNFFRGEFNNWIFGDDEKLFVDYILDDIPAMQVKRDQLWDRAQNSTFITENEKREMVGYETIDGGDVVLVPANMIPLGQSGIDEEQEEDDEKNVIQKLINEGMTREEAEKSLGLYD
jgi:HK97 family phage portal protein